MKAPEYIASPQELKAIELLGNSDLNNFFEMFGSNTFRKIERAIELVKIIEQENKLSIKNKADKKVIK